MLKRILAILLVAVFLCGVFPFAVFAAYLEKNLVLNREYILETGEPISKTYGELSIDGQDFNRDNGSLTDSKIADENKDSENWFRAYSGQSRIVSFDLGQTCRVSGVEGGFLDDRANDIYAPRYVKIYLSVDGENYECVKEYVGKYPSFEGKKSERYLLKIDLDRDYSARYVRIEYSCYGFTYCDELRVLGSNELLGGEKTPKGKAEENNGGYADGIAGCKDIVKLYNGYWPKDTSVGVLTAFELLPYVAYINKNGEIAGKMFDSAIILPCKADYPSGGSLYKTQNGVACMSDFSAYLDQTFTAGQDLSALNKVVKEVNRSLETDEKFGVFLGIPYPCISDKPFGDINGDGVEDYSITLEDRVAILKWYIDECTFMFASGGYDGLRLCGFYWLEDEVDYGYSDHEEELIKKVGGYADKIGIDLLLSFGYLSSGFDVWEELSVETAVMKAEMIKNGFSDDMLPEYSRSVYNNRFGVELETGTAADYLGDDSEYLALGHSYESYMYYGKKYGYSTGLNIYEQDIAPGNIYEFCYADKSTPKGIYLRRLYDLTYGYINNNYNNLPPTVELETKVEMLYGDNRITIDLNIKDVDSYSEDILVEFPAQPQNGKVVASAGNNKLIYSLDEGFVGEDSFTVCISDGFNRSEPVEVSILVVNPQAPDESVNYDVSAEPLPLGGQSDMPPWLIVLLVGLALAMVAVAITVAVKPRSTKAR